MVVKQGTRAGRSSRVGCIGLPDTLAYWRKLAAGDFDAKRRAEVAATVVKLASTLPEWKAAIAGNAGAAVGLVLRLRPPFRFCARIDLAMTLLLNCAFENAGAALVLSYALRRMPLVRSERARLSESWITHHMAMASPGRTTRFRADRAETDKVPRPQGRKSSRARTRPRSERPC
jgi:hypothetical protein